MIKNINAEKAYLSLKENTNSKLIDVRTAAEWKDDGYADLNSIGHEVHFISWVNEDGNPNDLFIEEVKRLNIQADDSLFFICRSGVRSQHAGNFLNSNLKLENVFNIEGGMEFGWKSFNLPLKS